jgi:hypothetical protein
MMIPVMVRSTNRREGTWLCGYASPDSDLPDVVRNATMTDLDRVLSGVVITNPKDKARHWLITVRAVANK